MFPRYQPNLLQEPAYDPFKVSECSSTLSLEYLEQWKSSQWSRVPNIRTFVISVAERETSEFLRLMSRITFGSSDMIRGFHTCGTLSFGTYLTDDFSVLVPYIHGAPLLPYRTYEFPYIFVWAVSSRHLQLSSLCSLSRMFSGSYKVLFYRGRVSSASYRLSGEDPFHFLEI